MKNQITINNPLVSLRSMMQRLFGLQIVRKTQSVITGTPWSYGQPFDMSQYSHAYRVSPYVFRCVSAIADNFAQVPFMITKNKTVNGRVEKVQLDDHDLSNILDNPNEHLSGFELKKNTLGYLELNGNAYWLMIRLGSGRINELHILRPDRVVVVPDRERFVRGYIYRIGDTSYRFDADDVIHFKYFNPYDDYYGQATLESARRTVNLDHKARKYNETFFDNSAMPRGVLSFEQELEDEDYVDIEEEWKKAYSGIDNAHKVAILEKGAKWENIGISQKDMDFIEMMKLSRDEIATVFGVPPVMINDFERATYNNAREQVGLFWHETEIPKIEYVKSHLNHKKWKLTSRRDLSAKQLEIGFDLSQVWALQAEEAERTETSLKEVEIGTLKINEFRASRGREPVPWGEEPPRQQTFAPTNQSGFDPAWIPVPHWTSYELEKTKERLQIEGRANISEFDEWKAFIVHSDRFEPMMRSFFVSILSDQEKITLTRMRQNAERLKYLLSLDLEFEENEDGTLLIPAKAEIDIDSVLFDLEKAIDYTEEASTDLYQQMTTAGGKRGFDIAKVGGSFDLNNPRAIRIMKDKQQKFAVKINETTWGKIKNSLALGIKEGESIQQLADRVKKTFKNRRSDKFNIARTEVIGSLNGGIHEGFKQTGVVEKKGWLDAKDEATRKAHREAGRRKAIPIDDYFELTNSDGGTSYMMYPGDPNGSAEQVCQCRCTLKPVTIRAR